MEFDFEGSYGTYHSNYDTRWYAERFSDPGFKAGSTLVQVLGLSVMRLANADVLPFRYSHYARKIEESLDTASGWAIDDDGKEIVALDLSRAKRVAAAIGKRAARLEQQLLDESEPPETRWYRHVIYGWNIYSLYEGQPLPGLAEAIRLRDAGRVQRETARIEAALQRMLTALDKEGP